MKKTFIHLLLFTLATIVFPFSVFSQEEERTTDTTKFNFGKSTVVIYDTEENSIDTNKVDICRDEPDDELTLVMDIGMNGYLAANGSLSLPTEQSLMDLNYAKSRSIGFSMMYSNGNLIGDRLYLSPGIGLNWNNYHFENNITISSSK